MIETHMSPEGSLVCKPWGQLDWSNSLQLRHLVHGSLEDETGVVIDLSQVKSIDATGLSVIVGCLRRAKANRVTAKVANVSARVRHRLDLIMVESSVTADVDSGGPDAA